MKKSFALILSLALLFSLAAVGHAQETISIIATSTPHAVILDHIKPALAEKGYDLEAVLGEADRLMYEDKKAIKARCEAAEQN